MSLINFLKKKYIRLQGSQNVLKINYLIEKYFKDKKLGNIGLDFSKNLKGNLLFKRLLISKIINLTWK